MTSLQMTIYVLLKALAIALEFVKFFIPHFQTYDLAVDLVPDQTYTKEQLNDFDNYEIICAAEHLGPGEVCDAICLVRELTWLCFGICPKQVGDIRPFVNPNGGSV